MKAFFGHAVVFVDRDKSRLIQTPKNRKLWTASTFSPFMMMWWVNQIGIRWMTNSLGVIIIILGDRQLQLTRKSGTRNRHYCQYVSSAILVRTYAQALTCRLKFTRGLLQMGWAAQCSQLALEICMSFNCHLLVKHTKYCVALQVSLLIFFPFRYRVKLHSLSFNKKNYTCKIQTLEMCYLKPEMTASRKST